MADHLPLETNAALKTATREATVNAAVAHVALVEVTKTGGSAGSRTIGSSVHHATAGASTNTANIKSTAGRLYSVRVWNAATYPVFLKFHNTSGTPTAGSGVVMTVPCEPGRRTYESYPGGLDIFSTGIGRSIVKGHTDSDTTVLVANDCVIDVEYA